MANTAVRCYAGHRYPERPRALLWEGQWMEVAAVEARWHTPDGPAFRVRTADGRRFALAYRETADTWAVEPLTGSKQPAANTK